jgi:type IV secretion system protein VirB10
MSKDDNSENNNKLAESATIPPDKAITENSFPEVKIPDTISLQDDIHPEENPPSISLSTLNQEAPEALLPEFNENFEDDFLNDHENDHHDSEELFDTTDTMELGYPKEYSKPEAEDELEYSNVHDAFDAAEQIEPIAEEDISSKYEAELNAALMGEQLDDLNHIQTPQQINNPTEPEKPEVDNSLSKIASSNTGSIALILIGLIVIVFIIYNSYNESKKQSAPSDPASINPALNTITPPPPSASDQITQPQMPKLPETPEIQVPSVVQSNNEASTTNNSLPSPTVPSVASLGVPEAPPTLNQQSAPTIPPSIKNLNAPPTAPSSGTIIQSKSNMAARYKTNMVAFGGNVSKSGPGGGSVLAKTSAQVTATTMGDLTKLIAQGKIIDGVLESAISTDLPGMVRAIVSRDTYAESGKNILIPKGSRLVGTYSASVQNGQARVQITWSRMMRPDGVDIALNSPSVDNVGRTGVVGNYEGRGLEQFTSALMVSALNYGMAALQDKQNQKDGVKTGGSVIIGGQTVPNASVDNSNPNGSMIVTTNPTTQKSQALTTASGQISSIAQTLASNYYQVQPRITIDQGAKIKVFVQYDLVFPGQPYNSISVVN